MDSQNSTRSYTPLLVVFLIVAAFVIGMYATKIQYLEKSTGEKLNEPSKPQKVLGEQAAGQKIKADVGHLPVLGNKDAKVTIIEFADFQCPFCERWFKTVEPNLITDYVKTGKVRFAFRHYAILGNESSFAAEASECANEQNKFWEFHDYLYNNQGPENSGAFAKDKLKEFAKKLGLASEQFDLCLDSSKYAKQVKDDTQKGQEAGVSGAPATFVNGQLVVGAQPYSAFKTLIDQELSK